ncbi:DUF3883 domain-containing protein [Priestia sp. Y58]|uniref:DUF3883 domain-containing protein n=1 Tax=Priestia sp. Y58 TaxID=2922804 RepID=UPI0024058154|nr:DUF3883 domain-containing protein [Priestia sp. Y58]MDG0032698.1 DUF3883 domain-containing protein [Priestia sp. Y58]
MENKFKLALIIAFYLSKFDMKAVRNLDYRSRAEAFREIGDKLDVNRYTIKQMRDQFDTLHSHRKGYYQFPLPPSRIEVAEKYKLLSEQALREIVKDIIHSNNKATESYLSVLDIASDQEDKNIRREYGSRGITGLKAEEIFIEEFSKGNISKLSGELLDTRQYGCGYDFELVGNPNYFFEVKGLATKKGSLAFTDKEWEVASKLKENYVLVFIKNINDTPEIQLVINPYEKLRAKKKVYTTISVNWNVDIGQLEE